MTLVSNDFAPVPVDAAEIVAPPVEGPVLPARVAGRRPRIHGRSLSAVLTLVAVAYIGVPAAALIVSTHEAAQPVGAVPAVSREASVVPATAPDEPCVLATTTALGRVCTPEESSEDMIRLLFQLR